MNAAEILDRIRTLRVLVAGDICLDRWCAYSPALSESSAETGMPRIGVIRTEATPGAGGTVANNLVALGVAQVSVLGVVGEDGSAYELDRALRKRGISSDLLIPSADLCTFTYTKLINSDTEREDRPRVDFINTQPMPAHAELQVMSALSAHWANFDVIIVADQAETGNGGVVTAAVRGRIVELAADDPEKIVWVDSRRRPELYSQVILKPNENEARDACIRKFGSVDFQRLAVECSLRLLVVTHGDRGALVIEDGSEVWAPARRVGAVDICGAGDSFSAGAACALEVTGSAADAARFGNLVASVTVTKKGTGTASPSEVLKAAMDAA